MDEKIYRQSRLCRLLGNPLAFAIVDVLGAGKALSPSEIARAVSRSVSRLSHVLAALRLAEPPTGSLGSRRSAQKERTGSHHARVGRQTRSSTCPGDRRAIRFILGRPRSMET